MEILLLLIVAGGLGFTIYNLFFKKKTEIPVTPPPTNGGGLFETPPCKTFRFTTTDEQNYLVVELCDGTQKGLKVETELELCCRKVLSSSTSISVEEVAAFCTK